MRSPRRVQGDAEEFLMKKNASVAATMTTQKRYRRQNEQTMPLWYGEQVKKEA
jgi:hypothetical protein